MNAVLSALGAESPVTAPVVNAKFQSQPAWTVPAVVALYELPFMDLVFRAAEIHRRHFNGNEIQRSTLFSVKTGGCSEDCGYCSQAKRNEEKIRAETGLSGGFHKDQDGRKEFKLQLPEDKNIANLDDVIAAAKMAKEAGASRFCMGAAWRGPKERDLAAVEAMVREVKALGMETCVTLGMLREGQAARLKEAGLDYYNHNLDSDEAYYEEVVSTHSYQDRLDTLDKVREAGLKVCSGGIIGMGESRENRAGLIVKLANMKDAVVLLFRALDPSPIIRSLLTLFINTVEVVRPNRSFPRKIVKGQKLQGLHQAIAANDPAESAQEMECSQLSRALRRWRSW